MCVICNNSQVLNHNLDTLTIFLSFFVNFMSYERKKRIQNIEDLLNQNIELSVKELAEKLQVSEMTVRRDLDSLEEQGKLRRTHGGAILLDPGENLGDTYILGEQTTKNVREKPIFYYFLT